MSLVDTPWGDEYDDDDASVVDDYDDDGWVAKLLSDPEAAFAEVPGYAEYRERLETARREAEEQAPKDLLYRIAESDTERRRAVAHAVQQATDPIEAEWRERVARWQRERELARKVQARLESRDVARAVEDAERQRRAQELAEVHDSPWMSGAEFLAARDEESGYRIAGLWETDTAGILFGPSKGGKSTMMINVIRSIIDGVPFLGTYDVRPVTGKVAYVDMELPPAKTRAWLRSIGLQDADRLLIRNLRGACALFDILTPATRAAIASELRDAGVEVLIIDPLSPLMAELGINQNSPDDVRRLWNALLALKRDAGLSEILATHHTGHSNTERGRGTSEFLAVPDFYWSLETRGSGHDADRVFSAKGRDVGLAVYALNFDPDTHTYTLGASKARGAEAQEEAAQRLAADVDALVAALRERGGQAASGELRDALGWSRGRRWQNAIDDATTRGLVARVGSAGRRGELLKLVSGD